MPRVCLDNGCQVPTHVPGRIRRNYIRTPPGDRAKAELSPHDSTKGRTIHRPRTKASNGDQVQQPRKLLVTFDNTGYGECMINASRAKSL